MKRATSHQPTSISKLISLLNTSPANHPFKHHPPLLKAKPLQSTDAQGNTYHYDSWWKCMTKYFTKTNSWVEAFNKISHPSEFGKNLCKLGRIRLTIKFLIQVLMEFELLNFELVPTTSSWSTTTFDLVTCHYNFRGNMDNEVRKCV